MDSQPRGWSKEDDKRLSSWCWSRSRVASLHCPLSSPAVLFQWRTDCNLHPCHVAWGGVEFVCLLHEFEVLTIGELDLNRFHGFNLSLICWDTETPFLLASSLIRVAVFKSVLNPNRWFFGFSFFLLSVMFFVLLDSVVVWSRMLPKWKQLPYIKSRFFSFWGFSKSVPDLVQNIVDCKVLWIALDWSNIVLVQFIHPFQLLGTIGALQRA